MKTTSKKTGAKKAAPRAAATPRGRTMPASRRTLPKKDWRELCARDVMHADVLTVTADTPLSEVERMLAENRVSGLPVTDEKGVILGVLSIRDLIDRYSQDPDARPRRGGGFYRVDDTDLDDDVVETFNLPEEAEEVAGDVMTRQVHSVPADLPLRDVAARMVKLQIHRLLVEEEQRTVGIVSTMDLLAAIAR